MRPITITTTKKVTKQDISDLFSCAMSGSTYWACDLEPLGKGGQCLEDNMLKGFKITDTEEQKVYTVTPVQIERALQLMADKYPRHWIDFINENTDATTGDVFLQLCVFKEVVYG